MKTIISSEKCEKEKDYKSNKACDGKRHIVRPFEVFNQVIDVLSILFLMISFIWALVATIHNPSLFFQGTCVILAIPLNLILEFFQGYTIKGTTVVTIIAVIFVHVLYLLFSRIEFVQNFMRQLF